MKTVKEHRRHEERERWWDRFYPTLWVCMRLSLLYSLWIPSCFLRCCCCLIIHPAKKPSRTLQRTGYTALRGTRSLTKTTTPATHVTVNMILASCVTLQFTCKHCICLLWCLTLNNHHHCNLIRGVVVVVLE